MPVTVHTIGPVNPAKGSDLVNAPSPPVRPRTRTYRDGVDVMTVEGPQGPSLTVYGAGGKQIGGHAPGTWTEYSITSPAPAGE